jgi:ribosomal-protein-serine acetyltransferase
VKPSRAGLSVDARTQLAPRHAGDATETFALVEANRAALRQWLGWVDATRTVGDLRRYAEFASTQFDRMLGFDYIIRHDDRAVGGIGLHAVDWGNRSAQLGYWLASAAQGRGLMTRACARLVTHALDDLRLHRIEIRCSVANARSRAVPQRLGFAFEGTLAGAHVLHGQFHDIALYATTEPAWRRMNAAEKS